MTRFLIAIVAIAVLNQNLLPCSICGDAFIRRQSLRQHFADAKAVLHGQLRNPKANPDGIGGATEFHISTAMKSDATVATPKMLIIPRYLPVIGDTPPDYLFFCAVADGKLDPFHGLAATVGAVKYLKDSAALDAKQPAAALAFFFKHLESAEETVANDAFLEFARAADKDILAASAQFDRAKLRTWIADAKVPAERLGVYSLLLGLCGTAEDAAWLAGQLALSPRPDRYASNLGGLLAGLATLDPVRGWPMIHTTLADKDAPLADRLNVIGCVRYFQATKPKDLREQILKACKMVIQQSDLADVAIDDLRRWEWWDLTANVLKDFDKQTSPLMKKGIVRYALSCPNAEAKSFIEKVRAADPKLVAKVEESLKK